MMRHITGGVGGNVVEERGSDSYTRGNGTGAGGNRSILGGKEGADPEEAGKRRRKRMFWVILFAILNC